MSSNNGLICPNCGYDLRGHTTDRIRCPECGRTWLLYQLLSEAKVKQWFVPALLVAGIGGVLCWIIPAWIDGKQEAWDGPSWWVWFLASGVVSFVAGYLAPHWFICWPFVAAICQFVSLAGPRPGALWPVGLCLFMGTGVIWLIGSGLGAACRNARPSSCD